MPSLRFFEEYCASLLSLRDWAAQPAARDEQAAEASAAVAGGAPVQNGAEGDPEPVMTRSGTATAIVNAPVLGRPRVIWNQLARLIDQQLVEASRIAGPMGLEFHREAVYAMAALTDEMFVHLEWEGREFWLAHLLEATFFKSHFAGESLFRRMDELLTRDDDPAGELAAVYLATLALGFRGRYWGSHHDAILDDYRKRLFFFISRRSQRLGESHARLFPEAYEHVIHDGVIRGIPQPRRWLFALAALVFVWLLATYIIWYDLTSDLKHRLCCLSAECSESCASANAAK